MGNVQHRPVQREGKWVSGCQGDGEGLLMEAFFGGDVNALKWVAGWMHGSMDQLKAIQLCTVDNELHSVS